MSYDYDDLYPILNIRFSHADIMASSSTIEQTSIMAEDTSSASDVKRQRTSHRSVLRVLKKKSLLRRKLLSKEVTTVWQYII